MTIDRHPTRRQCLACAGALAWPAGAMAAADAADAARKRPLAVKSACLDIVRAGNESARDPMDKW